MPLYGWECPCGHRIDVVAKVDDRDNTPMTDEEVPQESTCPVCKTKATSWKRIECASVKMLRGSRWRGRKGSW